ncbi:5'/3'-nucleotidase SurE [Clostridium lundense]|uniref:5'/3'-nucleotidase SurE n=1 Tax=Clostridium lundense TaxID=319475 RepID=UPI000488DF57|nr:5'/3'-nucleotidase SurE [Clostridium lundense]
MRLLLTNDDGIESKALYILAKELEKEHELIIAAPSNQKSACSHSITIAESLIIKKVNLPNISSDAYSISGTPADCVRVAVHKLLDKPVDMVISGINMGTNLGMDIIYSGTVSAAIEAAIYKIPSIAISSELKENCANYYSAAKFVSNIIKTSKDNLIKNDLVLNVNVPCLDEKDIKGIKVCGMGDKIYDNFFIEDINEAGDTVLKLTGRINKNHKINTDVYYLKQGYVTLTPLHYDLTNFKILNEVSQWF